MLPDRPQQAATNGLTPRQAARAVLLTPTSEILLMQVAEPSSGRSFWITPGGGLEPGESIEAGLRREVFEETGLVGFGLGPELWRRQHHFHWDGVEILQHERYFLVRVERFAVEKLHQPDVVEAAAFVTFRWWSLPDLLRSADRFVPRRLPALLQTLALDGPPHPPLVIDGNREEETGAN